MDPQTTCPDCGREIDAQTAAPGQPVWTDGVRAHFSFWRFWSRMVAAAWGARAGSYLVGSRPQAGWQRQDT